MTSFSITEFTQIAFTTLLLADADRNPTLVSVYIEAFDTPMFLLALILIIFKMSRKYIPIEYCSFQWFRTFVWLLLHNPSHAT
jgi:hypothetical protein